MHALPPTPAPELVINCQLDTIHQLVKPEQSTPKTEFSSGAVVRLHLKPQGVYSLKK